MGHRTRIAVLLTALIGVLAPARDLGGRSPAGGLEEVHDLESLILANSFRAAERMAAAILADPAADPRIRAVCGLAVLKAGRIGEAEAIFNQVIARQPDNPEAHLGLGRIARIRNDEDSAIAHLRRAVSSSAFYEEALRQLRRAAWDRGRVSDLLEILDITEARCGQDSRLFPSFITNSLAQIRGLEGKTLFEMEGRFERVRVPLLTQPGPRIAMRMISLRLNGQRDYLFDIDSASADFLTVSPLLAEELGLRLTGSSTAVGVGTDTATVRFSVLDKVDLGPVTFRNVPIMVSDIHPFKGLKKGLLGTGLLKRFNVTIDVEAGVMDLYPLGRPELLAAAIDRAAVAAEVPLYLFDATTVEASVNGAPPALYILDSAAATNLADGVFFEEHLKPGLDPAKIVRGGIQGAQGAQYVDRVDGLPVTLGPLVFTGQTVFVFPMEELNEIGGRYAAGLLGNPLLWPYRVHMDFRGGRLILEKRAAS